MNYNKSNIKVLTVYTLAALAAFMASPTTNTTSIKTYTSQTKTIVENTKVEKYTVEDYAKQVVDKEIVPEVKKADDANLNTYVKYYKSKQELVQSKDSNLEKAVKEIINEKELKKQQELQEQKEKELQEQINQQIIVTNKGDFITYSPTNPTASNDTNTISSTTYDISDIPKEELIKACSTNYNINIRDFEINEMIRMVEAEAGDQDLKGRQLVANVILNRAKSKEFKGSIHDILFAPKQFSPILDGRYWRVTPSDMSKKAVYMALSGDDTSQGALYFMQPEISSSKGAAYIRQQTYLFKHGAHEFYK